MRVSFAHALLGLAAALGGAVAHDAAPASEVRPGDVFITGTESMTPVESTTPPTPATPSTGLGTGPNDATVIPADDPTTTTADAGAATAGALPPYEPWKYSYPQPPIPDTWARLPDFNLDPNFVITDQPTEREYTFNIDEFAGAPDGFHRRIFAINGQFPGPLIECNEGDRIIVHVNNHLTTGQTLHWHGISQNGSNWADGVPGVSQCPIPSGGSFTYKFTVQQEFGTFWEVWHSHFGNTLADGIVGPLVVHSVNDPLKIGQDYDEERILFISDWMRDQSVTIVDALFTADGYRGSVLPPPVDAVLINGVGQSNCSAAQKGTPCDDNVAPAVVAVERGRRVRFRVINSGAHALLRLSIDNHDLTVVEVDDTPIQPITAHEFPLSPGQRMSIVVDMNQEGDNFWIRASVAIDCIAAQTEMVGLGVLRYGQSGDQACKPTTQPWGDLLAPGSRCMDIDNYHSVVPIIPENPPAESNGAGVLNSLFGFTLWDPESDKTFAGFGFNGIPFFNKMNVPMLHEIEMGRSLTDSGSTIANLTFNEYGAYDIIVNQLDTAVAHPFHLHGRKFHIVARGEGNITSIDEATINTENPLRRDTLFIPTASYAVLRLITDTPGVWPFHCHIGWHLATGKMAMVVVRPDVVRQFERPYEWANLCVGTDPNAWGPARRRRTLSPQLRRSRKHAL